MDPSTTALLAWADEICEGLAGEFQFLHCGVFLYDPGVTALRLVGQRWGARRGHPAVRVGEWLVPLEGSVCGRVFRTGRPALVADVALDPDFRDYPGGGSRSELAVPIPGPHGEPIGVLNVESPRLNAFTVADLERLTAAARRAGEAYARLVEKAADG